VKNPTVSLDAIGPRHCMLIEYRIARNACSRRKSVRLIVARCVTRYIDYLNIPFETVSIVSVGGDARVSRFHGRFHHVGSPRAVTFPSARSVVAKRGCSPARDNARNYARPCKILAWPAV